MSWVAQFGCGIGGAAPQALTDGPGAEGVDDDAPDPLPDSDRDLTPGGSGGGGDPGAGEGPGGQGDGVTPVDGGIRFVRITSLEGPSWVSWREIQVFVAGVNVAGVMGRVLASGAVDGQGPGKAVDGDETTGWNSGQLPPAWIVVDLGEEVQVERVVGQVQQMPPGRTVHMVEVAGADGDYKTYRRWATDTRDGMWLEAEVDDPSDDEGGFEGEGILAPQREDAYVLGDVEVVGNRFEVDGHLWYPKTDFLTSVAPGEDILDGNTHTYLGRNDADRRRIRQALVGHAYNSIYVYTLNQGDYGAGRRPDNVVTPYGDGGVWSFDTAELSAVRVAQWRRALEELLAAGLKPFLWLAADDSPDVARADLGTWRQYVGQMVEAFDDLPVVWVVGLEVDEYWSPDKVRQRREAVQALTDRPVGVHLTTGETRRNRADFTAGFDFVMGQLESPQGDAGYRADVRNLASLQAPWIAAEFNVRSSDGAASVTERSKQIGRVMALIGDPPRIAGIGNGIDLTPQDAPDDPPDLDDPPADGVPFDLADVTWLHTDVSGWDQTATLLGVSVNDRQICLDYDHADIWPVLDIDDTALVGNPWIFIEHDGRWWGATWEWLRPGQTCKNRQAVAGDHIKRDPFWGFTPQSGVTYGFMVSGLARSGERNALERTNVVMFTWP